MSEFDPRTPKRPINEGEDLTPDAYEATVPTRLTGFRGTNPALVIVAFGIAAAIVALSVFSFLHRGAQTRTAEAPPENAQPAAPGIGGIQPTTPFVPGTAVTPFPVVTRPPRPYPDARRYVLPDQRYRFTPGQISTEPDRSPAQIAAQSPENAQNDGGRMQLDQPPQSAGAPAAGGQDAQAAGDLASAGGDVKYVPVYRNGRIVAVVPTSNGTGTGVGEASASPSPAATQNSAVFTASEQLDPAAAEKRRFVREQQGTQSVGYAPKQSIAQLDAATVINARLLTKIESDVPGSVIAQVSQPVYDSATHHTLVIPAGTKLVGVYDNTTETGQTRLLMAWNRLVFPDGEEFDIAAQEGADAEGTAGFSGDVDPHRGQLYTSAILLTVLGGVSAALSPNQGNLLTQPSVTSQVQSAAGAQLTQVGDRILNQSLQRTPTIIIRPPYGFNVIVTRDLPLQVYVEQHP